jgi:hypothetical protein
MCEPHSHTLLLTNTAENQRNDLWLIFTINTIISHAIVMRAWERGYRERHWPLLSHSPPLQPFLSSLSLPYLFSWNHRVLTHPSPYSSAPRRQVGII